MFVHQVGTVLAKELRDSARDRRSMVSAFAYALFGPLLVAFMLGFLADQQEADRIMQVPVLGGERVPALLDHLRAEGAEIIEAPTDYRQAVQSGDLPFVLVVSEDFVDQYQQLEPARLELLYDNSRSDGRGQRRRLERAIESWSTHVVTLRLLARGLDPRLVAPVELQRRDLATPSALGAQILGSLPMFFLLSAFVCGMSVAIDTTAGERERGSLESLLVHAAPTEALAIGKWLAAVLFNVAGLVFMLGVSILVLQPERFTSLGVAIRFGIPEAAAVLVVMLPLVIMVPALQMLMAIFARSFKEAQTYLSLLIFLPMIPGFMLLLDAFDITPWMHSVPVLAQQIQIVQLIRGEPVSQGAFFGAALTTLGTGALLVWLVGRLLGQERIVMSR